MIGQQFVPMSFVMDRVHRDYGFADLSIPDVAEDLWDFVGIIGIPQALEDKVALNVPVEEFRTMIPLEFYTLQPTELAIKESKTGIPFRHLSDRFYLDQKGNAGTPIDMGLIAGQSYFYDPLNPTKEGTIYAAHVPEDSVPEQYTYRLSRDHIFVGKKKTEIDIAYIAFPVDDYGAPMIADDPKYIRAAVTYLGERIAFRLWIRDKIQDKIYDKIAQDYYFAAASVQTYATVPSTEVMENLVNRAKQILKGTHHFLTGFKTLGNVR